MPELMAAASAAGGLSLLFTGWRMELATVPPITTEPETEGATMALERYRLRIFDGQYEVLHNNRFYVDVDLDSTTRGAILNTQLVALVELGRIANEPMDRPVMKVCDHETGRTVILDWIG